MTETPLLMVTGMSGAGLSTALKALEDSGFDVVDNIPLSLIDPLVEQMREDKRPVAVGIDARTKGFSAEEVLCRKKEIVQRGEYAPFLVYMDSQDEVLARRFTETRRRHPLARDRTVMDGIAHERNLTRPLLREADKVIDTSDLTVHDLRRIMKVSFAPDKTSGLHVTVMSFGFKHGLPRQMDLLFDVRFLRNPHFDPELKPKTGTEPDVIAYIQHDKDYDAFRQNLENLLKPLLPRYHAEGKSYLTLAIGCTGGRHRSVHMAEHISQMIAKEGYDVYTHHRDILK